MTLLFEGFDGPPPKANARQKARPVMKMEEDEEPQKMANAATASPGARFTAINDRSRVQYGPLGGTDRSGKSALASAKAPTTSMTSKADKKHERAYMACLNCRKYKTRCDRGPDPDRPQPLPCGRCRRESRQCILPDARRKRSKSDAADYLSDEDDNDVARNENTRKRSRTHSSATTAGTAPSLTHRRASQAKQTARTGDNDFDATPLSPEAEYRVQSIKESMSREGVLGEIAEIDEHIPPAKPTEQPSVPVRYQNLAGEDLPPMPPLNADEERVYKRGRSWNDHSPVERAQIKAAWSRFILVRHNKLSKIEEGIHFIECFYAHLAPLTPIAGIGVNHHEPMSHMKLLNEEPLLALTIITIAARFFEPDHPGAPPSPAVSTRAWMLQQATWETLRNVLADMVLGQEESGADFTLPGEHKKNHSSKLRNFDAIESLLLLTEWHSKELHFPDSRSQELMLGPVEEYMETGRYSADVNAEHAQNTRRPHWLESCLRSSRMCWALTCNALSIAIELGIWDTRAAAPRWNPDESIRARRVGSLLYIFLQLANSRLPNASWKPPKPDLELLAPSSKWIHDGEHDPFTDSAKRDPTFEEMEAETIWHWHYLVSTWREANETLFKDPEYTKQRIKNWDYLEDVLDYDTRLAKHSVELGPCRKLVPRNQRRIMNLELQYYRVHICSIALQAVWTRMTDKLPHHRKGEPVPASLFEEHVPPDQPAINRIIDASLSFLATVTTFAHDGSMPYLPAHSYFRIIFVSYTLMKVFYLGLSSSQARQALVLVEQVAKALQRHAPDDTHVSTHIGGILKTLADKVVPSLTNMGLPRRNSNETPSKHNGLMGPAHEQQTYASDQQTAAMGQFGMVQIQNGFDHRSSGSSMPARPQHGYSRGQRQQDQDAREAYVRRLCRKTPSGTADVLGPARQIAYGVNSPKQSALPPRSLYTTAEQAAMQYPIPQSSRWTPEYEQEAFGALDEEEPVPFSFDAEQPSMVALSWGEMPEFGPNDGYAQHLWEYNNFLGHAPMSTMANAAEPLGYCETDQWQLGGGFENHNPFPQGPQPQ